MSNNNPESIITPEKTNPVIEKNMNDWFDSLLRNPEGVVSNYDEGKGTLHSTLEDFKKGPEEILGYFKHFLENNPKGEVKEENFFWNGDKESTYTHSGVYTFELDNGSGGRILKDADFTFVWGKDKDDKWKIIHHHSSLIPSDEQKSALDKLEIPSGIDGSDFVELEDGHTLYVGEMMVDDQTVRFTVEKDASGNEIHRHLSYQV